MEEYAEKYGRVNVVVGPIFDYNADGHADKFDEIEMCLFSNFGLFLSSPPPILNVG